MRLLLILAAFATSAFAEPPHTRFDRQVLEPTEASRYRYVKLHGLEVPELQTNEFVVTCLVYQDDQRIYVEAGLRNRSGFDLAIASDFITLESGDAKVTRTPTVKMAEQIERAALKPFVPEATGKSADGRRAAYARDSVERQAQQHVDKQEREVTFAGMLVALAQEKQSETLEEGKERVIACTFEQRTDHKLPLRVIIRAGAEKFVFTFHEPGRI